jgi:hypothetical protein
MPGVDEIGDCGEIGDICDCGEIGETDNGLPSAAPGADGFIS